MAEALKYEGNLDDVFKVYSDIKWRKSARQVSIFDEKKGEYVPLNEGDYIVSIGERYEVSEKKPAKAKTAEVPEEADEPVEETEDDDAGEPHDDELTDGEPVVRPGGEPVED